MEVFRNTNAQINQSMLEELRGMHAVNVLPPLPPSPRVRCVKTGYVYNWSERLAMRSDIFRNCDEFGDTDPSKWMGRFPEHYSGEAAMEYVRNNPVTLDPDADVEAALPPPAVQPLQGIIVGVPGVS